MIHNSYQIKESIDENENSYPNDINHFLFYQENIISEDRVESTFIQLLFYFCMNYESFYKVFFERINKEIYQSFDDYNDRDNTIYYCLEIIGILLYLSFFVTVLVYLYYSNMIIIKNLIFLFLDFTEEEHSKEKDNKVQNIISKLLKFKDLINDFDLNNLKIYSDEIDQINKKFALKKKNTLDISQISTINDSQKEQDQASIISSMSEIKTKKTNNSSHNYLLPSDSTFFRDKLNSNSTLASNGNLISASSVNSKNTITGIKNDLNTNINIKNMLTRKSTYRSKLRAVKNDNNEKEEKEDKDIYQEAILNKSNKKIIFIIKIQRFNK